MDVHHPADVALRFVAVFSQVQESCETAIKTYLRVRLPALSATVLARMRRMSDDERIRGVWQLASDLGLDEQAANIVGVYSELKALRDTLSHATMIGSGVADEDGPGGISAIRGAEALNITTGELIEKYFRAWWLFEQVTYVGAVAGERTWDGDVLRRQSGVSILDSPPPVTPPAGGTTDPVVLWEVVRDEN